MNDVHKEAKTGEASGKMLYSQPDLSDLSQRAAIKKEFLGQKQ
jgi:hypothetical protein